MIQSKKKTRICFVSPKAYPIFNKEIKATFGGAEVDLYHLGTELAKDPNYEVCFITADYGQADTEQHEGVTIIKSLDFEQNSMMGAIKIWRALHKADAEMYMIKSISAGLFEVGLFCRLHRKVFLYRTAHTTHCDGTYLRKKPFMGKLFKYTIKRAKIVFTQNEIDREQLLSTTGVESVTIPNGHRLAPISETSPNTILWVGRSADFKHPERFLELARTFSEQPFTMICQKATGDRRYNTLRQTARAIENLNFIEHVPFHEIDRYFQEAKIFVNTSDAEGFPNTFIQACKAGTAILSYNVNPDEFLNQHQCGICCDGDMKEMKHQLAVMLKGQYEQWGKNGRHYAEQKHNIQVIVDDYKKLILTT